MSSHDLRDRTGKLLGKIKTRSDGKLEGRTATGHLVGTYDPQSDKTRGPGGQLVGKGDLLASLIVED